MTRGSIRAADQAVDRVAAFTRVARFDRDWARARSAAAPDLVPYLRPDRGEREAWEVRATGVRVGAVDEDLLERELVAWVAVEDGALLSVRIDAIGADAGSCHAVTAEDAEEQLTARGETFHEFVTEPPRVVLAEALESIRGRGVGDVLDARSIEAFLVVHSSRRSSLRPVWSIHLRGFDPRPAHGPHADAVPADRRDHLRNVVDARTGDVLFATSCPQPSRGR